MKKFLYQRLTTCTCFILVSLASIVPNALAFELTPAPTQAERILAKRTSGITFRSLFPVVQFAAHKFSDRVHEGLGQLAYDCPLGGLVDCADAGLEVAPIGVIVGIRWNDDPPFQFSKGQGKYSLCPVDREPPATISFALTVDCWLEHFRDVSKEAERNPLKYVYGEGTLLARSHFGDLQFLHAMADRKGVPASETRRQILMWSEFAWRVQSGSADRIRRETRMGMVPVSGMLRHFPANEERSVELLFTVGRPWMRLHVADIAFGSFLHMLQDSFAGGHATRRPRIDPTCNVPEIVVFHTYAGQDKDQHKDRDSLATAVVKSVDLPSATGVVGVMRELVRRRVDGQSWAEVKPYLEDCVFKLADENALSTTGVEPD